VTVTMFAEPRVFISRRPAFAILNLNIPGASQENRLLPLIFYHAPSNRTRAQIGTFLSALSRQVNVANQLDGLGNQTAALVRVNKTVIGGDFNYRRTAPPDFVYRRFNNAYSNDINTSGGNLSFDSLAADATTVQIRTVQNGRFNGPPVEQPDNAAYRRLPIDQLMYRLLPRVTPPSGVVDMLAMLRENPSPFAPSMADYFNHFNTMMDLSGQMPDIDRGPRNVAGNPVFGDRFTDWIEFYSDLGLPDISRRFHTARSAAEFMHIFVSDHLPLLLAFDI
jgi:hypothetical protein